MALGDMCPPQNMAASISNRPLQSDFTGTRATSGSESVSIQNRILGAKVILITVLDVCEGTYRYECYIYRNLSNDDFGTVFYKELLLLFASSVPAGIDSGPVILPTMLDEGGGGLQQVIGGITSKKRKGRVRVRKKRVLVLRWERLELIE